VNLRTRVLVLGGFLGILIGVAAALLYLRATPVEVDDRGGQRLPRVRPAGALAVGLGVLSVLKQIVGLGEENHD